MKIVISVLCVLFAVFFIAQPKLVAAAVGGSVADCLEIIVPSLFAFTALSIYLQKSGLYRVALRPLTFPLSKLLRMDEELCAVFVLANIGGYPVGTRLLSELTENGRLSKNDAGRMLCCCFGSGPSFVIGIAGMCVFDSAAAGLIMFAACFLSSLMMAAIVRARGEIRLARADERYDFSAESFVSSVTGGAKVMFTVCVMIVGFSALTAVLKALGVFALFEKLFGSAEIFPAIMEISRIKDVYPTRYALPLCAAMLSFGGVCVQLQILALSNGIPLVEFFISRVVCAAFSAIISMPFSRMFAAAEIPVLAPNVTTAPFTKNAVLSLCVLIMCAILLASVRKSRRS